MKTIRGSLAVAAVALAVSAPPTLAAEEPTRDEYKAKVEPICKANTKANENILAGVRKKVQQGKLGPAGRQFIRASTALKSTLRQLKAVPKPPADVERLTEWLKRVGDQATLLQKIGKALVDGNRRKAETLSAKLVSGARLTNAIVVSFSFNYCRFEPSKYT
jgi:hypothetical protein